MPRQSASAKLADLFEYADIELGYWDRDTRGAVQRQISEAERKLIIKALRRPQWA